MESAARALTDLMIKSLDLPPERRDVLAFGLTHLLLNLMDLVGLTLAAILSGVPGLTLSVALTAMSFRSLTGGAHLSNPWRCAVFSYGAVALLGALSATLAGVLGWWPVSTFVGLVGLGAGATIWRYAPVDSPAKPISGEQARRLRRLVWWLLGLWVIWEGVLLALGHVGVAFASGLGLLVQTLSLTPGEARVLRRIDEYFTVVRKKEAS